LVAQPGVVVKQVQGCVCIAALLYSINWRTVLPAFSVNSRRILSPPLLNADCNKQECHGGIINIIKITIMMPLR
jgi:hypothetical protein